MAVYLVRTCARYSWMKSLPTRFVKMTQILKQHPTVSCMPCVQCTDYHTSFVYLKKKSAEQPKVVSVTKRQLPVIEVWNHMTVSELADSARRDMNDVLDALSFVDSSMYQPNSVIENTRVLLNAVKRLGVNAKFRKKTILEEEKEEDYDVYKRPPPDESVLIKRRPVVTIMGHVDHGKTTLLDTLRHTAVVSTEFGGITQHIGAFNVTLDTGEMITFLDTPGHAAFSAMRARGAKATDIVVLVVAADDGVMDQTVQSIEMATAANVPIIVAINKIDKPEADIGRTQKMLAANGIIVEDLGGEIQSVNISALKNINLNTLVEVIMLQADLMDLKGDPTGLVEGTIIESSVDVSRGKLATILVQRGTLRKGSVVVSGLAWAKVRSMFDHSGKPVIQAGLSDAVQVIGWKELPSVGEELLEVPNERIARTVMRFRESREAAKTAEEHGKEADKKHQQHLEVYKEELAKKRSLGRRYSKTNTEPSKPDPKDDTPKVNVIIKGDVLGSVEAILDMFETYKGDQKCRLDVVHYGVGPITETDVELAKTFDAIIYAFNVPIPEKIKAEIKDKKIKIRPQKVIYSLIDDIKKEIDQKMPVINVEEILGEATVLQEFEITEGKKKVKVAGCRCTKGMLKKSDLYRLVRNGETLYTGKLSSMKHLKNEVNTIKVDIECGLKLKDPTISFQPGDVLVCFKLFKQKQSIEWDTGF